MCPQLQNKREMFFRGETPPSVAPPPVPKEVNSTPAAPAPAPAAKEVRENNKENRPEVRRTAPSEPPVPRSRLLSEAHWDRDGLSRGSG